MSPSGQMQERGPPSPLQQPPPPTNVPPDVIQQSHSVVAPTSQEAIMPHVLATSDGVDQRMAPPLPAAPPAHSHSPRRPPGAPRNAPVAICWARWRKSVHSPRRQA